MNPAVLLLVVGAAGLVVVVAMLGMLPRRRTAAVIECGLEALRTLRWKEFSEHVVHAFQTRGYEPQLGKRRPGEDGVDFVLARGKEKHLLQIKHGGAYAVGQAPVKRLLQLLGNHEASGGILVTSGHFEPPARQAARGQSVVLIDGEALWSQLQPVLPASLVERAESNAAARIAQRQSRLNLALAASLFVALIGAGIGAYQRFTNPLPAVVEVAEEPAPPTAAAPAPATPATPPPAPEAEPAREASAVTTPAAAPRSIAPPPPATEEQLAQYRELAAASVLLIEGVIAASWPTRSTMLVSVKAGTEEARLAIVDQVCNELTRREDLRFTRLQVQDYEAEDPSVNLRWRNCR